MGHIHRSDFLSLEANTLRYLRTRRACSIVMSAREELKKWIQAEVALQLGSMRDQLRDEIIDSLREEMPKETNNNGQLVASDVRGMIVSSAAKIESRLMERVEQRIATGIVTEVNRQVTTVVQPQLKHLAQFVAYQTEDGAIAVDAFRRQVYADAHEDDAKDPNAEKPISFAPHVGLYFGNTTDE